VDFGHVEVMTILAVALGGAFGAIARYGASGWVQAASGGFFPWGTLAVNGSLALGFAVVWLQSAVAAAGLRELITIGFLGSFTTFSTFSYEALAMIRDGEWWRAGGYTLGSVAVGIAAVAVGAALGALLTQPGA
jgi:CrcB protein